MLVVLKSWDVGPQHTNGTEPFATIRARVDLLGAGEGLTVSAPFLPSPLIENLNSEGFQSTALHQPDGIRAVNFWQDN